MGIDQFHKILREKHTISNTQITEPCFYDHVYIDMNALLHNAVYNIKNVDTLFKKLKKQIDNILEFIVPVSSVSFASDGPAAYAKLMVQRKRRLEMSRKSDVTNLNPNHINPIQFTPGTNFMKQFEAKLEEYFCELELSYLAKNKKITVYKLLSGHGEAEIKLMDNLIKNHTKSKNKEITHAIVSKDADVVVMAMATPYYKNIRVIMKNNTIEAIDVGKLVDSFASSGFKPKSLPNMNRDFAFLCILLGNDYMPKVLFVSYDKIFKSYWRTGNVYRQNLINDDGNFNQSLLKHFLNNLVRAVPKAWTSKFNISEYNNKMYKEYMEGLLWCLKSYSEGRCVKYNYIFEYEESVHLIGLLFYMEQLKDEQVKCPDNCTGPIPEDIYAVLVLPKKAHNLIDKKYTSTLNNNKELKFLYEEEDCNYCVQTHDKLAEMNKTRTFMETTEQADDKIKQLKGEITILTKLLTAHKKCHRDITLTDITKVIKILRTVK